MELPAEIRIKILTELLWQQEPLRIMREAGCPRYLHEQNPTSARRSSTFSFCPAVLLVCRALHEEGVAILYSNTVGCEIWCEYSDLNYVAYQNSFLRHSWDIEGKHIPGRLTRAEGIDPLFNSAKALLSRVKRLDVVVRIDGHDACIDTRSAVRGFVEAARLLPMLSEMDIHLCMGIDRRAEVVHDLRRYEDEIISVQDYKDFALGPFALLRNLKSVTFTGVSSRIAEELGRVMMSQQPVVDLPRMYDNLIEYTEARISYGHCRMCCRAFDHADRALIEIDMEDERAFRRSRSKILDIIADHERAELAKLLLNDTAPSPTSKIHVPVSDVEEEDSESITQEDEYQQTLRDMEESEEDREFKREQEKDRPSLVRLREVVCKEIRSV